MNSRGWVVVAMWLVWAIVSVSELNAHPFHVSLTEAEWNEKTRSLEVAMKVHAVDLEVALSRANKRRTRLEDPLAERAARDYVFKAFRIGSSDSPSAATWVGWEIEDRTVWLYFEIPLQQRPDGMPLQNTTLFHVPGQSNTVVVRAGSHQATLTLTVEKPTSVIRFEQR